MVGTPKLDARPLTAYLPSVGVPLHEQLDKMHNLGRLPALGPHTSTSIERCAPLR